MPNRLNISLRASSGARGLGFCWGGGGGNPNHKPGSLVGRAINNPSNALPPFWMIKLTEAWGEPKNDSKGEDDGLKIEQGEGTRRKKYACTQPLFVWRTRTLSRRGL